MAKLRARAGGPAYKEALRPLGLFILLGLTADRLLEWDR